MGIYALVAASVFNAQDFRAKWKAGAFDCIVAVDGGYAKLNEIGCVPNAVIGDFDSLGYVPDGENVLVHPTHKDKSDLELAFDYARENGATSVAVYGALGDRLDHTMANVQMGARFAECGMEVVFFSPDCALHIVVGPATFELPRHVSGTVSVFAACDCARGVTERGLEYPLVDAELSNRTTLGVSNELTGATASVSVCEGTLYVFCPLEEEAMDEAGHSI